MNDKEGMLGSAKVTAEVVAAVFAAAVSAGIPAAHAAPDVWIPNLDISITGASASGQFDDYRGIRG